MKFKALTLSLLATASLGLATPSFADGHGAHSAEAFDHSHRSDNNKLRDEFRKPFQTLAFFGVKPDSKVVEIMPGGGWYTEILAPMLKAKGTFVAAHYTKDNKSEYRARSRNNYDKKLAENAAVYGNVQVVDFGTDLPVAEGAKDADVVLTFRGLHGLQNSNQLGVAFAQYNEMLKKGGKLGIVQHQAPEGFDPVVTARKGYLPKSYVISVAKAHGFKLVAEAYFHNNPKDNVIRDNLEWGVWSLPPSLRDEANAEKLKKVGESNRMTLLFEKI